MSNIDFTKMVTAEQRHADEERAALESVLASRRAAYLSESDPLWRQWPRSRRVSLCR